MKILKNTLQDIITLMHYIQVQKTFVKQILFKLRHNYMEIKNDKTLYEAPSTMVFEVKTEGVICQSGVNANRNGYGAANELTWDE